METSDIRVEVFVHLDAVGVELEFGGVEQRLLRGEAGDNIVDSLDEVDYVVSLSSRPRSDVITVPPVSVAIS